MKRPHLRTENVICCASSQSSTAEWLLPNASISHREEGDCFVFSKHPENILPRKRLFGVKSASTIQDEFGRLATQWRRDVMFLSDSTERTIHPAYQHIIEMGSAVIPLMLKEISERHEHWFAALEAITGEDPVNPEDSGDVRKISQAWIDWGRKRGYSE